MIYPNLIFGVVNTMAGSKMTTNQAPSLLETIHTLPAVFFWLWMNLLLFNVANQRLPASLVEDEVNKPWRPIPSKRITTSSARHFLLCLVPIVLICAHLQGVVWHSLCLIVLTWMYNDLEGADEHFLVRNIINSLGMGFYSSGAMAIACGRHHITSPTGYQWIGVVSAIVLTTLQVQDMGDQAGDRLKGRKTLPLVMGDGFARWTIASSVMLWSIAGPAFWRPGMLAYVLPFLTGSTLALRVLLLKSIESDKASWKMWCVWMVSMYLTPLLAPSR